VSPHSFTLILFLASAVLAVWVGIRFPDFGPSSSVFAALHMLAGMAAIRAIPGLTNAVVEFGGSAVPFVASFGIFLPLMTYTFLTGLWVMRLIQRTVSGDVR
jgi:hypothetical protein